MREAYIGQPFCEFSSFMWEYNPQILMAGTSIAMLGKFDAVCQFHLCRKNAC